MIYLFSEIIEIEQLYDSHSSSNSSKMDMSDAFMNSLSLSIDANIDLWKYKIYAIVGYYGFHYMAWLDYEQDGEWYFCEDTKVTKLGSFTDMQLDIEAKKVIPYIVLYRKMVGFFS